MSPSRAEDAQDSPLSSACPAPCLTWGCGDVADTEMNRLDHPAVSLYSHQGKVPPHLALRAPGHPHLDTHTLGWSSPWRTAAFQQMQAETGQPRGKDEGESQEHVELPPP